MKSGKKVGVWMDYSSANVMDPGHYKIRVITSKFSPAIEEAALKKGEKHMHQKEEQLRKTYFKEIAGKILGYEQVLLFGPTKAKEEFLHYLDGESSFKQVKIAVESTDKMTDNEKKAFVKKHFMA